MKAPFDPELFQDNLKTSWVGREFIYLKEIDSTNLFLKQVPADELCSGTVALTDFQTNGRGQYEKNWVSNRFDNLTFTLALRPSLPANYTLLTLGCASAIAETVQPYTSHKVELKWPNDLIVEGKKLGGLLTEAIFLGNRAERVLVGIGLNIHQQELQSPLMDSAISLCHITEKSLSREKLLCDCLLQIEKVYHQWESSDSELLLEINKRLIGYGEWVHIQVYNKLLPQKFKFIGVSGKGELLMLNEQLDVNKFCYEQVRIIPVKQRVQSH